MTDPVMPERWGDDTRPTGPLTRAGAAASLGVSVATVRRMEGRLLHPLRDARGHHVFDRVEVEALAQTRARRLSQASSNGKVAARVFTMLEDGADLAEIVVALAVDPAVVRRLYEEWRVDLETHFLAKRRAARLREEAEQVAHATRDMEALERRLRREGERQ